MAQETVGQSNPTSQLSDTAHGFAATRGGRTNTRCGVSDFFLLYFGSTILQGLDRSRSNNQSNNKSVDVSGYVVNNNDFIKTSTIDKYLFVNSSFI